MEKELKMIEISQDKGILCHYVTDKQEAQTVPLSFTYIPVIIHHNLCEVEKNQGAYSAGICVKKGGVNNETERI